VPPLPAESVPAPPAGVPWSWSAAADLLRLQHQSGTLLLMLPTWWALVLASTGRPSPLLLAVFAGGSLLMRSAGVAMNDLADRSFDRDVSRTRSRPLASGRLQPSHAKVLIVVLVGSAAALSALLPLEAVVLSPIALALSALYPFSKRLVSVPQAVLGLAFGWGVVMAWAAVRLTIEEWPAWLLYAATICWALGYDTIYALQDVEDDRRLGVRSAAVYFAESAWIAVAGAFGAMILLIAIAGWLIGLGGVFYGLLAGLAGFLAQQIAAVKRGVTTGQAFSLFKQHVWVGWGILAAVWAGFL
jgi:4-hydroxybenzoate polyprenyltransferase